MKANQFIRNTSAEQTGISIAVSILLVIIVGILVYWSVVDAVDTLSEQSETFTGYVPSTNSSSWSVELDNSPNSVSDTNVTCYNSSGPSESYPAFTLGNTFVYVTGDSADEFDQVNVTYTSKASSSASETNTMSNTIFALLPILVLVFVSALIIAVVIGFGGGRDGL